MNFVAAKRGLIPMGDEPRDEVGWIDDPDFDPLELLGVFLLRHNPAHDNSWESNPYVHSFRKVIRQIRNEVLLEQPLGEVGDLVRALEDEKKAKGGGKLQEGIMSSVLTQGTSKQSCLADGIWDACEDPGVLLSVDARSTLFKIVAQLSTEDQETKQPVVDTHLLKTLLLTYVEEIQSLEFVTKNAVQTVVRSMSSSSGKLFLTETETLKVLQRIIRMLKQTDLQPLLDYTVSFVQQTDETRKTQTVNALLYELFEALDEIKTGYISRPKVLGLLEKFYKEATPDTKKTLHDPRKWPLTSIIELAGESREPSLPSGSTPTIFDVDDYQSLLSGAVDAEVVIPQAVMEDSEEPQTQLEHPFLQHIFRDYPPSNSNGASVLPEDDLPESVANDAKKLCETGRLPSEDLALVCKVYEIYKNIRSGEDRAASRPKKVWSVHSSPFMETVLTKQQFAVIIRNFLGDSFEDSNLEELISQLRSTYQESSDELIARLRQEQIATRSSRRKEDLEYAFDSIDNAAKNSLEHGRFLKLWLFTTLPIKACDVRYVLKIFCYAAENTTGLFSKKEFVEFFFVLLGVYNIDVDAGCSQLREELCKSMQAEQVEQTRTVLRKSWLKGIAKIVATCGGDRNKLYEEVVAILQKDAKIHLSNKIVTISIALLEKNTSNPTQGLLLLRFVTASSSERKFLLQKAIFPGSNDIGFAAVNMGKKQRVDKISDSSFSLPINADRRQGTNGSFICYPLTDQRNRIFGVMNLDTLGNKQTLDFSAEETDFHESVLRSFCDGFLQLDLRRRNAEALAVGLPWFGKRVALIVDVELYFVEPDEEQECPCLRKAASSVGGGASLLHPRSPVCRKSDPGFNERLVTCAVTAESVKEKVHNEQHLTTAIRDLENFSSIILDITFRRSWPEGEVEKDVINLLAICQQTFDQLHKEEDPEGPVIRLAIEREVPHLQHRFIFDRLLLLECRQVISKIPATILAEIRATSKVTASHLKILRAVLTSLYPLESEKKDFEDWNKCKDCVRLDLLRLISEYDPTVVLNAASFETVYKGFRDAALMSEQEAMNAHPVFKFFHRWCVLCLHLMTSADDVRKQKYAKDFQVVFKASRTNQPDDV